MILIIAVFSMQMERMENIDGVEWMVNGE